jgi:hypothetical protein
MGHHSFQWSGGQLFSIRCFSSIVSNSRASSGAALDSSVASGRNNVVLGAFRQRSSNHKATLTPRVPCLAMCGAGRAIV